VTAISAGVAHANHSKKYFPLDSGNSWTFARYHPAVQHAPWTMTVVQATRGMAWVVGMPGFENGVWLSWGGETLYAWNASEGAWKPWLRFGARSGTTYTVNLGRPMWTQTRVTVDSNSDRVRNAVLGSTFYNCKRFSFSPLNPDAGMVNMYFAPTYGLVQWSKRSGLTPTSGALMSAVLSGKKFGTILYTVAAAGPDWNPGIPMNSRTTFGPGGSPFQVINDAEAWDRAKRGISSAEQVPMVDWTKQSVILIKALHVFNSRGSISVEDVQWNYRTQEAFVKVRLKTPREGESSLWYSPYCVLVTEEKVPKAKWHMTVSQ